RFLAYAPDGRRAVSVGHSEVILWSLDTGAEAARPKGGDVFGTQSAAFSPDGRTLLTYDHARPGFHLANALTRKEIRSLPNHNEWLALAFAAEGKNIVAGGRSEIFVCDLNGKELRRFNLREGPYNGVDSLVFSADGRRALTLDRSTPMRVLDLEKM